jgi:hypothetical protein
LRQLGADVEPEEVAGSCDVIGSVISDCKRRSRRAGLRRERMWQLENDHRGRNWDQAKRKRCQRSPRKERRDAVELFGTNNPKKGAM